MTIEIRPYQSDDKTACVEIFRSNQPRFFADEEFEDFVSFLNNLPCSYFCLIDDEIVIGCGGYFINEDEQVAGMAWGMVHNSRHGTGLGKLLLLYRLAQICQAGQANKIIMDTSQHTFKFFEKLGFIVTKVISDGYGAGLDRVDMELIITDKTCSYFQLALHQAMTD